MGKGIHNTVLKLIQYSVTTFLKPYGILTPNLKVESKLVRSEKMGFIHKTQKSPYLAKLRRICKKLDVCYDGTQGA